ncbi:sce7726 family protein [Algoriphagus sp. NBT04N3]|jgi:hypothetical protein|uniref:sce7726 family protein n=1 Tax=Algoriphagus sp. NBT04N3 TaxID=2705473 RepID=UPI001C63252E|nr:sce7726 family protein [Algoriphagus sp. NBT04N3]QYH40560.1 sce7726 family protein [Algoriphagus sp. NBT04N3]
MKDPCIRELLKETELKRYISDNQSKVVEELNLPVAKARIDIAVINGSFHGFEIKSASDTLKRLPSQIEAYSKVFDYLSIVTEGKFSTKILNIVPKWIGIYLCKEVDGVRSIEQIRKSAKNKNRDGVYIAKLLWRDELIECLQTHNIPFRKKDRNWLLCEAMAKNLDVNTLSSIVRCKIKERINWKGE